MRNRIVPGEFMSATQKSWRGLGSEAVACHETKARRTARRRKEEEDAIWSFSLSCVSVCDCGVSDGLNMQGCMSLYRCSEQRLKSLAIVDLVKWNQPTNWTGLLLLIKLLHIRPFKTRFPFKEAMQRIQPYKAIIWWCVRLTSNYECFSISPESPQCMQGRFQENSPPITIKEKIFKTRNIRH